MRQDRFTENIENLLEVIRNWR